MHPPSLIICCTGSSGSVFRQISKTFKCFTRLLTTAQRCLSCLSLQILFVSLGEKIKRHVFKYFTQAELMVMYCRSFLKMKATNENTQSNKPICAYYQSSNKATIYKTLLTENKTHFIFLL